MCREAMNAMGDSAYDYDEFYGKGGFRQANEMDIAETTERPRGCTDCLGTGNIPYRVVFFTIHFAIALSMGLTKR